MGPHDWFRIELGKLGAEARGWGTVLLMLIVVVVVLAGWR
jgi:hypothetical protein